MDKVSLTLCSLPIIPCPFKNWCLLFLTYVGKLLILILLCEIISIQYTTWTSNLVIIALCCTCIHWYLFDSSFIIIQKCTASACFEKLYLRFAIQLEFWFISTTIKVTAPSDLYIYAYFHNYISSCWTICLYCCQYILTHLRHLGQEVAINFVFLCTEICWEGLSATHVLKLRRSLRFKSQYSTYSSVYNNYHHHYHDHHLKYGLPELLLLRLVLTEPLQNNLAEVGKVDEALPDDRGHDYE